MTDHIIDFKSVQYRLTSNLLLFIHIIIQIQGHSCSTFTHNYTDRHCIAFNNTSPWSLKVLQVLVLFQIFRVLPSDQYPFNPRSLSGSILRTISPLPDQLSTYPFDVTSLHKPLIQVLWFLVLFRVFMLFTNSANQLHI